MLSQVHKATIVTSRIRQSIATMLKGEDGGEKVVFFLQCDRQYRTDVNPMPPMNEKHAVQEGNWRALFSGFTRASADSECVL